MRKSQKVLFAFFSISTAAALGVGAGQAAKANARNGETGDQIANPLLQFKFTQAELDAGSSNGFVPTIGDAKYALKIRGHWQNANPCNDYTLLNGGGVDFHHTSFGDGTRFLVAMDLDNDIYDSLGEFTMAYEIQTDNDHTSDGWGTYLGTQFNTTASKHYLAMTGTSGQTRLCIDGNYWDSKEYSNKSGSNWNTEADAFQKIIITVSPSEGKLKSWCNGKLILEETIGSDFNLADPGVSFSVGGAFNGGGAYYTSGAIKNLEFYDYAFTNLQADLYNNRGYLFNSDLGDQKVIDPIAHYEFNDATDPGKDSMGNYNLTEAKISEGDTGTFGDGNLSVSDGKAIFDGTGALCSPDESHDLSEDLTNFTFSMDVRSTATDSDWRNPVSFAWAGWGNDICLFTSSQKDWLRLNASKGGTPLVDGSGSAREWGIDVGNYGGEAMHKFIFSLEVGGKLRIFLDGTKIKEADVPADWSLKCADSRFCLGAINTWAENLYYRFIGEIGDVKVYNFAMNDDEIKILNKYDALYESANVRIASIDQLDYSSTIIIPADATDAEILAGYAPAPETITVTMTDGSTKSATVTWNAVVRNEGEVLLKGDVTGVVNSDDVKAYAKLGLMADCVELLPVAKYEFADPENPGKDSMGHFDLQTEIRTYKEGGEWKEADANIAVEDGAITFDGNYYLVGKGNEQLGSYLKDCTVSFEIKTDATNTDWACPVSFGQNDWNATKWAIFQFSSGSDLLRFTSAGGLDDQTGYSNIDGNGNSYWGKEIGHLGTETHKVQMTLGDHIKVYLDGACRYDYAVPEGFNLKIDPSRFTLGGTYNFGQYAKGTTLSNVAVYDFAATADQIKVLNATGKIKNNIAKGAYVTSIEEGVNFEGESILATEIREDNTSDEMLAALKTATVTANLSNGETTELPVEWYAIAKRDGKYYAKGHVGLANNVYTQFPQDVEVELTVTAPFAVTVAATENGTVTVSEDAPYAGDTVVITITPDEGYEIDTVKVNGEDIEAVEGVYSFVANGDATVTVTFKAIPVQSSEPTSEPTSVPTSQSSETPVVPSTGGCGGSVLGASALICALAVAGIALIKSKKND